MNLKRLAQISPIIGAFLIFIGYLRLHLYYSHWNINIANYLDFSELTLSFLNDANTILFFTILILIQMTLGIVTLVSIDNKIKVEINQTTNDEPTTNDEQFTGIFPAIDKAFEENHKTAVIALTVLTAISTFLFLFFLNLTFLYLTFVLFVQLLVLFLDKVIGIKDERTLLLTSFAIILLGFTYCLAKYEIKQSEISSNQTVLQTSSNETICTDKNFIFLGKTNNYYFFFDKVKNQTTIIQGALIIKTITTN